MKDDVREVRTGFECGIRLRGFNEFTAGRHPGMLYGDRKGGANIGSMPSRSG